MTTKSSKEWKDFITSFKQKIKDLYLNHPKVLIQHYQQEIESNSQYNGRQLLELLQNADDESSGIKNPEVMIKLEGNELIVANNGYPFSEAGVDSLGYARVTGKKGRRKVIGHKGLGFRSILNWAEEIQIFSGNLCVKYSNQIAESFLQEMVNNNPEIQKVIKNNRIATLSVPEWINERPQKYNKYDTYIIIKLNPSVRKDLEKQINEIQPQTLIFLNNLTQIDINTPKKKLGINADRSLTDKISISTHNKLKNKNKKKLWNLRREEKKIPKNLLSNSNDSTKYNIQIAYTNNLDDDIYRLFSYFITKEKFPFPALVHASLNLNDSRDYMVEDEINQFIMKRIGELMIEISLMINKKDISWNPLKFLSKRGEYGESLKNIEFDSMLIQLVKKHKLIPTKKGYVLPEDAIYIAHKDIYPILSKFSEFSSLSPFTNDDSINDFIQRLEIPSYNHKKFESKINEISSKLSIIERALLIKFIVEEANDIFGWEKKLNLKLFIDNSNQLINPDSNLVLPPDEIFKIDLPDWVSLRFISNDLCKELQAQLKLSRIRDLRNNLTYFKVQEYNLGNLIGSVIYSTKRRFKKQKTNDSIRDMLQVLKEIYQIKKIETFPEKLKVPIFNTEGKIKNANDLYFGKEYSFGIIAHNLLHKIDSSIFLADITKLGFREENSEFVKFFFNWLGVSQYPRKKLITLKEDRKNFEHYIIDNLEFPLDISGELFKDKDSLLEQKTYPSNITVDDIPLLSQILQKAKFEDIITWLNKDHEMQRIIFQGKEINTKSKFGIWLKYKQSTKNRYAEQIPSYIHWRLSNSFWIPTESNKLVSPSVCIVSKLISDLSPIIETPKFNIRYDLLRKFGIKERDIETTLINLKAAESIKEISWDRIYEILLELPNQDPKGIKAKRIYNQIIKNKSTEDLNKNNPKYLKFLKSGKLLGIKEKEKGYYSVSELKYIENVTLPQAILNRYDLLDIDRRVGARKVKDILGVDQLTQETVKLKIKKKIYHPLHQRFQKEIENLKPYIYFFRIGKDKDKNNLRILKNLKIALCSKLIVLDMKDEISWEDYKPFPEGDIHYIQLKENHSTIDDLRKDLNFRDSVSILISNALKVADNQKDFRELFHLSKSDRDKQIIKDSGEESISILRKCRELLGQALFSKWEFWDTIFQIKGLKLDDDISTDQGLLAKIRSILPKIDIKIFNRINYDDYSDQSNLKYFENIFSKLKINLDDFNSKSFNQIDFSDYLKEEYSKLRDNYQKQFKDVLYSKLITNKKRGSFQSILNEYSLMNLDESVNVFIPILDTFLKDVNKRFGISLKDYNIKNGDLDAKFFSNKKTFEKKLQEHGYDINEIQEYIENFDDKALSYLYYGWVDQLISEFKKENPLKPSESEERESEKDSSFERIKKKLEEIKEKVKDSKVDDINISKPKDAQRRIKGSQPGRRQKTRLSDKEKEEIGLLGEQFVYEKLLRDKSLKNIKWVSLNAKKAEVNPNGNDNLGYDLTYEDSSENLHYIEVKSSKNDDTTFTISKNEVEFGESHVERYEIWLVRKIFDESIPTPLRLTNFFKYAEEESFTKNTRFVVENENFRIRFLRI